MTYALNPDGLNWQEDNLETKMIETLGWLGNLLLAVCAVPQAWASFKQGHSDGITKEMLWLWGLGTLLALPLQVDKGIWQAVVNYNVNLFLISVIVYFKLYPRK